MKKLFFIATVGMSLALGGMPNAKADFLAPFTGNSQFFTPGGISDGIVNFSVFDNSDGDLETMLLANGFTPLIIAGLDLNDAQYAYFYQIVNTNPVPPEGNIIDLSIPIGSVTDVLQAGYLDGRVFNEAPNADPSGPTGPAGNTRLGGDEVTVGDDIPGTNTPSSLGSLVSGAEFIADGDLNPVTPIDPSFAFFSSPVSVTFTFSPPFNSIPTPLFSSVFFFTSNIAPGYHPPSSLRDGGPSAEADIPVPTPEPGTFLMGFAAVICGLGAAWKANHKLLK